jgi:hypothetical protein
MTSSFTDYYETYIDSTSSTTFTNTIQGLNPSTGASTVTADYIDLLEGLGSSGDWVSKWFAPVTGSNIGKNYQAEYVDPGQINNQDYPLVLSLKAAETTPGGLILDDTDGQSILGAQMETGDIFKPGMFLEIEMAVPNLAPGMWPALWLDGDKTAIADSEIYGLSTYVDPEWPSKGEFDLFEHGGMLDGGDEVVGSQWDDEAFFSTVHCDHILGNGKYGYTWNLQDCTSGGCSITDPYDVAFQSGSVALQNKYGLYWSSDGSTVCTFLNGALKGCRNIQYGVLNCTGSSSSGTGAFSPKHVIINLAAGGALGGGDSAVDELLSTYSTELAAGDYRMEIYSAKIYNVSPSSNLTTEVQTQKERNACVNLGETWSDDTTCCPGQGTPGTYLFEDICVPGGQMWAQGAANMGQTAQNSPDYTQMNTGTGYTADNVFSTETTADIMDELNQPSITDGNDPRAGIFALPCEGGPTGDLVQCLTDGTWSCKTQDLCENGGGKAYLNVTKNYPNLFTHDPDADYTAARTAFNADVSNVFAVDGNCSTAEMWGRSCDDTAGKGCEGYGENVGCLNWTCDIESNTCKPLGYIDPDAIFDDSTAMVADAPCEDPTVCPANYVESCFGSEPVKGSCSDYYEWYQTSWGGFQWQRCKETTTSVTSTACESYDPDGTDGQSGVCDETGSSADACREGQFPSCNRGPFDTAAGLTNWNVTNMDATSGYPGAPGWSDAYQNMNINMNHCSVAGAAKAEWYDPDAHPDVTSEDLDGAVALQAAHSCCPGTRCVQADDTYTETDFCCPDGYSDAQCKSIWSDQMEKVETGYWSFKNGFNSAQAGGTGDAGGDDVPPWSGWGVTPGGLDPFQLGNCVDCLEDTVPCLKDWNGDGEETFLCSTANPIDSTQCGYSASSPSFGKSYYAGCSIAKT